MFKRAPILVLALGLAGCGPQRPATTAAAPATTANPHPPIVIESPAPHAEWSTHDHVDGTAVAFEATIVLELHQDGHVLAKKTVTASEGAPYRGTFDATLDAADARAGPATIVAYEPSAADGSHLHEVHVPVVVTR